MSEADTARLEAWAYERVHMSVGWGMMLSQEANKALRHCAIGLVTDKTMKSRPKHPWEFWRKRNSAGN
jgi:hypothetical protein